MANINLRDFPPLPSQGAKRHARKSAHVKSTDTRSRRGSGASLNALPDELILHILQYLPGIDLHDFQLRALLNLSLTNWRLHRIVNEKIYENYDSHFCEPYTFLRTMITNPELADLVQEVSISFGAWAHREGQRHTATARDKKLIKEGLRALAIPGWKDWASDCNGSHYRDEAIYKAIPFYTRHLKSLQFQGTIYPPSRSVDWFEVFSKTTAGILSDKAHGFQQLQSVKIDSPSSSIIQIAPLFQLQSLQTLQLREVNGWRVGEDHALRLQRLIPRTCNNLENLSLEQSFYPKSTLIILLASPRKLKSFKYELTTENYPAMRLPRDESSVSLSNVLDCQKKTLQTIDVYCDQNQEVAQADVHVRDSLQDFSTLKWFICPLSMMMSSASDTFAERLPRSLLTFRAHIRPWTDDQDYIGGLEHMIANYQPHTPQLQEIIVASRQSAPWLKYDWGNLVQLSSKAGLDFKVDHEGDGSDKGFGSSWGEDSSVSSASSDEVDLYSDDDG